MRQRISWCILVILLSSRVADAAQRWIGYTLNQTKYAVLFDSDRVRYVLLETAPQEAIGWIDQAGRSFSTNNKEDLAWLRSTLSDDAWIHVVYTNAQGGKADPANIERYWRWSDVRAVLRVVVQNVIQRLDIWIEGEDVAKPTPIRVVDANEIERVLVLSGLQ
jgi:hypothetical protein